MPRFEKTEYKNGIDINAIPMTVLGPLSALRNILLGGRSIYELQDQKNPDTLASGFSFEFVGSG